MEKKDVLITIKGRQHLPDERSDFMEFITSGMMMCDGEDFTIQYSETDTTGLLDDTNTTLLVQGGLVTLLRQSDLVTQMVFEQGRKHLSYYYTPEGSLTVGINSRVVDIDMKDNGGDIQMDFDVEINHSSAGKNSISIEIRETGAN